MSATANIPRTLFAASSLALIMIALGPGCDSRESGEIGEAPSAIANPASVYCANQGYTLVIRTEQAGEYGVCVFPDGTSCRDWAFYQGTCGQSFSYCSQHRGQLASRAESDGSAQYEYSVCVFPDMSECAESDYFEGKCRPSQCRHWSIAHGCVQ